MIGQIETYDPDRQSGVIKSEGTLYSFNMDSWMPDVPPDEGDDVNFDAEGAIAGNINLAGAYLAQPKAVKYKYLAAALALFLGFAGMHRLYLGFYLLAFFQLTLTVILYVTGLPGFAILWAFIEFVLLLAGHINKDAKGRPLK